MAIERWVARARWPVQDQRAALGDELGSGIAAQELQPDRGLEGEVEVLDGAQEREACLADRTLDARLSAVRDLLGDQGGEEVTVGLVFGLGALFALGVEPAHRRQMQTSEHAVEIERVHQATSLASAARVERRRVHARE